MENQYTFDNYSFSKEMGIEKEILGCYINGEWYSTNGGEFM